MQTFTVSADHVHPEYRCDRVMVVVHQEAEAAGGGFFANMPPYGCGKTYRTAHAAVHGLLSENGCTNIRLDYEPAPEPTEHHIELADEAAFLAFVADNPDEIEAGNGVAQAWATLLRGEELSFGGGAAPIFRVTLAAAARPALASHPHIDIPEDMPAFMVDVSWRNDGCARFEGGGFSMWVDAVDPSDRWDVCTGPDGRDDANDRFVIGVWEDDWRPVLSTNDWVLARGVLCLAHHLGLGEGAETLDAGGVPVGFSVSTAAAGPSNIQPEA